MTTLILASTSIYRKQLLERLRIPFISESPHTDETPLAGENPVNLVQRLAKAKALAVSARHSHVNIDTLVIGSDQVIDLEGEVIGKPHTHEQAIQQLQTMRGRQLLVHTAVAVARCSDLKVYAALSTVSVTLRDYCDTEIETYLRLEKPYDCAGAIKSESLGIALIERIDSSDPTSLIGLPLTDTLRLLRLFGVNILAMVKTPS